jgi:glycerophosphoryl diester phosphodiesterase
VPNGIPYSGIERTVVEALREQQGIETAQIISFDIETLGRVHALESHLVLGYLASRSSLPPAMRRAPDALAELARSFGFTFLGLDRQLVAPGHLRAAKTHGLRLAVWTVNDRPEMQHLVQMGVDSITSDRPDILRAVLDQHVE